MAAEREGRPAREGKSEKGEEEEPERRVGRVKERKSEMEQKSLTERDQEEEEGRGGWGPATGSGTRMSKLGRFIGLTCPQPLVSCSLGGTNFAISLRGGRFGGVRDAGGPTQLRGKRGPHSSLAEAASIVSRM